MHMQVVVFVTLALYSVTSILPQTFKSTSSMEKIDLISTYKDARMGVFSFDSRNLALVDTDHVLVETLTSARQFQITRKDSVILGARFSPDGQMLATAEKTVANSQNESFKVTLWNAVSGEEVISLPVTEDIWYRNISDISFSKDGKSLASNIGGIPRLWNTSNGTEAKRFQLPDSKTKLSSERVLLSPDGNLLAVYFNGVDPQTDFIHIWNLYNRNQMDLPTDVYRDWAFSADSKFLAVTATQNKGTPNEHSSAEIWDVSSGKRTATIESPKDWRGAYAVAVSPDSTVIAIAGYKKFGLFSVTSGKLLAEATHTGLRLFSDNEMGNEIGDIKLSPDGKVLLTGGNDNKVKLWRVEN